MAAIFLLKYPYRPFKKQLLIKIKNGPAGGV